MFARDDKASLITLLETSDTYERCWLLVHTDEGPILACAWYRPPGETLDGIKTFESELERLRPQAVSTLIIGDMNVHFRKWLVHSGCKDNTAGRFLYEIATKAGLKQIVRAPTRMGNLLDLVLTDMIRRPQKLGAKYGTTIM